METVVRQVGAATGYWPEALESLGHFLRHDAGKAGQEEVPNRVRTLFAELTPESLESRVRFLVTEMPWDYPCDEALDFATRDKRQVEAVRTLVAELVQQPVLLEGVLPQLSRGEQRMTYAFGVAVTDLADSPLDWFGIDHSGHRGDAGERTQLSPAVGLCHRHCRGVPGHRGGAQAEGGAVTRACAGASPALLPARDHPIRYRSGH